MTTNIQNLISVSYGLGLDSTALLMRLHARGVRPDFIIFADTGGEKPETYEYMTVINAWLVRVGFPLVTVVKYQPKRATYTTLEGKCLANEGAPSAKTGGGTCSSIFKADVINKWLQTNAQVKAHIAAGGRLTKMIGYDDSVADRKRAKKSDRLNRAKLVLIDERRACNKSALKSQWEVAHCDFAYPLQDEALERPVLAAIIRSAGLLVPVKSACFFCPNSQPEEVVELRLRHPDLYARALRIEHVDATGKHAVRRRAAGLPVHPGLSNHGVWMWSALADCSDPSQARAHLRSKGFRISAVSRHPADEAAAVEAPVAAVVQLQVLEAQVAELRVAEAPAATYGQAPAKLPLQGLRPDQGRRRRRLRVLRQQRPGTGRRVNNQPRRTTMKTRSVPRHLWPSDRQRVDHAGNALHDAADKQLAEFRAQGMPRDLAGALKWLTARRVLEGTQDV